MEDRVGTIIHDLDSISTCLFTRFDSMSIFQTASVIGHLTRVLRPSGPTHGTRYRLEAIFPGKS
jgi:hypothetical protein